MFKDKTLLITGGTGTFGNAVLQAFLDTGIKEIRIFSRDEKKQEDMRKKFNNSKIKFYIGDVRDYNSVNSVMHDVDYVFHAAALKQVPSCELFPVEALQTNAIRTEYVFDMQPIMEISGSLPYNLKTGVERTVQWMREQGEI